MWSPTRTISVEMVTGAGVKVPVDCAAASGTNATDPVSSRAAMSANLFKIYFFLLA